MGGSRSTCGNDGEIHHIPQGEGRGTGRCHDALIVLLGQRRALQTVGDTFARGRASIRVS